MTIEVGAIKDHLAATFEASGMAGRGFRAVYRVNGGAWTACRVNRGAEGMVSIWMPTAEGAKAEAKAWIKAVARKRQRGAVTA